MEEQNASAMDQVVDQAGLLLRWSLYIILGGMNFEMIWPLLRSVDAMIYRCLPLLLTERWHGFCSFLVLLSGLMYVVGKHCDSTLRQILCR